MLDHRVRTFLCVCQWMNYTKAAEALHMTQPGVSQHIRYLEEYYGCPLFVYRNRKLAITAAGEQLRRAFLTMGQDTETLRRRLSEGSGQQRMVRFGATLSIGEFLLPERAAAFALQERPDRLVFEIANTRQLLQKLDEGRISFALVEGNFPKDRYDGKVFREEPFAGVCGASYSLGQIERIGDLCRHPLILREDGSGTKDIFERLLGEYGYGTEDFPQVYTVSSPHVIKGLLEKNLGISFFYRIVAARELEEGRLRMFELPGIQLTHGFHVIWSKGSLFARDNEKIARELLESAWEENT